MQKYVIFDIDGTLNQTELYAVEAYQKALLKRGLEASREKIIACIGLSPVEIAKRLLGNTSEAEFHLWKEEIEELELNLMEKYARPFDGIEETLQALKTEGYELAVCSNAFPQHIENVLKVLKIWNYFKTFGSLEMGQNKTEVLKKLLKKLKPLKSCMVGDRKFDFQAARANDIPFIGCAYGYAPDEIQAADIVVKKPSEILEAVTSLI